MKSELLQKPTFNGFVYFIRRTVFSQLAYTLLKSKQMKKEIDFLMDLIDETIIEVKDEGLKLTENELYIIDSIYELLFHILSCKLSDKNLAKDITSMSENIRYYQKQLILDDDLVYMFDELHQ